MAIRFEDKPAKHADAPKPAKAVEPTPEPAGPDGELSLGQPDKSAPKTASKPKRKVK